MNLRQRRSEAAFYRVAPLLLLVGLALIYAGSTTPILTAVLGSFFFFLPGYLIARYVLGKGRNDISSLATFTVIISLSVMPLVGFIVQIVTFLSPYTLLLGVLALSAFFMLANRRSFNNDNAEQEAETSRKYISYKLMAFLGALAIGLGLYLQASIGVVAPRGEDIYRHMNVVNNLISTGKAVFVADLNILSNYYVFLYSELSLLTGLDVLTTALLGQTMLGAVYVMSMFYFAHYVTGKPVASFIGAVLFIAGPPLYSASSTVYFWYFHPMWVGMSIFPLALAYIHKVLVGEKGTNIGLASLLITASFLYHLAVGLILIVIVMFDFALLLAKLRNKAVIFKLLEMLILTFSVSSVLTIPFLLNVTNPFKFVYPQGGLQTLYNMFFGVSNYSFTSPLFGWRFLSNVLSDFVVTILPILVIGIPGLVYLFFRRSNSFVLILACLSVGILGVLQPLIGISFIPQRFSSPLIMFGSTLVGASLSLIMFVPNIQIKKHGSSVKIRVGLSRGNLGRLSLLLIMFSYVLFSSFLVLYSPAQKSMLEAELVIHEDDLIVIKWINENTPKDSKILMDQYFQTFFTGITGRKLLFSIAAEKPLYELWNVYPVNVYLGQTDPLSVGVDYIVISRWAYTTWHFVGQAYFDGNAGLKKVYEYKGSITYGLYAVYQVTR